MTLLTGGQDRHYVYGLATALAARGVAVEVVGSAAEDGPEMHTTAGIRFLELYGRAMRPGPLGRVRRVLGTYARLMGYLLRARPRVVHILWDYKLPFVDRVLMPLLLAARGRRLAFTAHNVNAARRDGCDSWWNRATLRLQYRRMDRIFVHTEKMREELVAEFGVEPARIVEIPYGVNNAVRDSELTGAEARRRLELEPGDQVLVFFGAIKPYKGLDLLVEAFERVAPKHAALRLVIAGERKQGWEECWDPLDERIEKSAVRGQYRRHIRFIPDDAIELYLKAADLAVLPYTEIFQSGVLFLAYAFGLPVLVSDVGSLREHVVEGETGLVCRPNDAGELAQSIESYFASPLYRELERRRPEIRRYFAERHSWDAVAERTDGAYAQMTGA